MKKRILLSLFASMLCLSGFAQEGVKIGFRLSPMVSWGVVTNDSSKTVPVGLVTSAKLGFAFDFVFTYGFNDNFAFRSGINIVSRGFKSVLTDTTGIYNSKMSFTSIEVPLGFKFRSPEFGSGMSIVGFFALAPSINVQNKQVYDAMDTSGVIQRDLERVDVDGVNFFTCSFTPGVGLDWQFDWGMLEFGVTYHWGLMSYVNKNSVNFTDLRMRMNAISLNLGYYF